MGPSPPRPGPLRHVELLTRAPFDDIGAFYDAWGLEVVDEAPEAIAFRGSGPDHHLVRFVRADHVGLGHIAFAAGSRQAVDDLHRRWEGAGVEILSRPEPLDSLGEGYGFEAVDLEGRRIRVITEMVAADPRPAAASVPVRLTHVVLNTVDIDALCAFWVEALGFAVSDWSEHQMVFLRNTGDHHSIAFNQAEHASVNHLAFELPSLDAFLASVGRMKTAGVEPLWGIGRHGPGNNCFAYYGDPAGFVPELTAEVQQIDDEGWVPRVWQRRAGQSDLWHLAGPPSPEFRRVGAGVPDPNLHPPDQPNPAPTKGPAMASADDLEALMESCLATRETRDEDWDTLAFQTKAGEQFRRAQIRYMGSGGTGNHEADGRIIQAEHFTFSNMMLPPGAEGPEHNHHDVEEAFFVLEGQLEVRLHDLEDGDQSVARVLEYRDFIRVPAGVPRSLKNVGDTDALFCVMLGTGKPQLPTYPPTSPMVGITRD